MTARGIAAGALAAALLAMAAPAWPCGPPGSMDNNNGGQGGNANTGGVSGQGQSDNSGGGSNWNSNNGGGASGAGDSNGGGGGDSGAGENARQGASDQASRDLGDNTNDGGRRSEENTNQGNANYTTQIGSLGQQQAASDDADCRALRAKLDELTGPDATDPEDQYKRAVAYFGRVSQMSPDMLDKQIDAERNSLDDQDFWSSHSALTPSASGPKSGSRKLDFLLEMRTAQATGIGKDTMQRRMQGYLRQVRDSVDQEKVERRQKIADLRTRIANLNCDTYLPAANQNVGSPSPSPSPNQ